MVRGGTKSPYSLTVVATALFMACAGSDRASAAQRSGGRAPAGASGSAAEPAAPRAASRDSGATAPSRLSYAGRDAGGVPHYVQRAFSAGERAELRSVFGIEDPNRLYLSDSTATGYLKYDTAPDHGRHDLVYSYSLGFVSLRRPGESWSSFQHRVQGMNSADFPASARTPDRSLDQLDPAVQPLFRRMISAARAAGFPVEVVEVYRTPQREAYLLSRADGRTYTATSLHSYGRAVDVRIGDGDVSHAGTRKRYIAFRRWVLDFGKGGLKLIGTPDQTWDWSHVEAPAPWLGYHSIEALLAAAHRCATAGKPAECRFRPHLSGSGG